MTQKDDYKEVLSKQIIFHISLYKLSWFVVFSMIINRCWGKGFKYFS
jgi:hypothetical protein